MENQCKEREISLIQLWKVFKKSFIFLIIAGVIGVSLGVIYVTVIDKPVYKVETSFIVTSSSPDHDYTSSAQTGAAVSISVTCAEFVKAGGSVQNAVEKHNLVEKFGLTGENAQFNCTQKIISMLNAYKTDKEDALFTVSVTSGNKELTYETIIALQDVIPEVLANEYENKIKVGVVNPVNNDKSVKVQKSSPITMGLLGGVAFAVIAYAVFFVISMFDTAVYGEDTIKEKFSYPIVGQIPTFGVTAEERLVKKNKKRTKAGKKIVMRNYENKIADSSSPFFVTEAFNTLRTNLLYSAAVKNPVFAMTSDVAGAGKTMVSANLAASFANLGKKVLLVECDMRCPSFGNVFGMKVDIGTSELLAGLYPTTDDVITDVGIENLDVIFGGKIPPNPSELLSGYRMNELVAEWKTKYDFIILDMPPIGEVFDAGVVSSDVNGYVLTVRCNHSNINDVRESFERIAAVNGNVLGVIINDIDPKTNRRYKVYYGSGERSSGKHSS